MQAEIYSAICVQSICPAKSRKDLNAIKRWLRVEALHPRTFSSQFNSIHPHQNRNSLKNRTAELTEQVQGVLAKTSAPGIRSETEKRELADSWLELAVSCAKVPVKFEADSSKQQQKQAIPQLGMG